MLNRFKNDIIPTVSTFELTDELLEYFKKDAYPVAAHINGHSPNKWLTRTFELMIFRYTVDCGYAEINSPLWNDLDKHIINNYMDKIKNYIFN